MISAMLLKPLVRACIFLSLLLCIQIVYANNADAPDSEASSKFIHTKVGNPYLPLWEHVPDGEPRVFEDPDKPGQYRLYLIGSHDVRHTRYCGFDTRIWSAPVEDLTQWRDDGPVFSYRVEGKSDVLYAPDLVELVRKDGTKEYYLYPHSRGQHREAMVAKGYRPDGPFTPINLSDDGLKTLPGSVMGFDPAVYIEYVKDPHDQDFDIGFRAYGYWGFQRSQAGELDQSTLFTLRPGSEKLDYFIPAGRKYGEIRDPEGTAYPYVVEGENLGDFNFFEAASIRKVGNKYVWVYSGYSGPEYGLSSSNSALRYAYGDTPLGPWKSGGVLVDSRAPVLSEDGGKIIASYSGHNTHGSIELINDQWYVFYHRAPRSFGHARQAMVAPVNIAWDEAAVSDGGTVKISAFDPYNDKNLWIAQADNGHVYHGAEVTSEGFHIYGLDPYQYYSAGYASYLSNRQVQQDSWDMWDNSMPITGVRNGNIIGYKYFGFGGLKSATKGLKPFAGTQPGNKTAFNVFLKPKSPRESIVEVWLDGPWKNKVWNGTKLGEIVIPKKSQDQITRFSLDVSAAVDQLDGKHALYLVAKGEEEASLFDLIGLGFSSKQRDISAPIVPSISIQVNGSEVELPPHPVRATPENGIVSYDTYALTHQVPNPSKAKVTASASLDDVSVSIVQAQENDGTAMVTFVFRGVSKTYYLEFIDSSE
jgi:arabinoxylan arabinofuranohydrolase